MLNESDPPNFDAQFFARAPHLMGVFRRDLFILQANPTLRAFLGPSATYTSEALSDAVHPSDRATLAAVTGKMNEMSTQATLLFRLKRNDGKYIWTNWALIFHAEEDCYYGSAFPMSSQIYDHMTDKNVGPAYSVGGWQLNKATREMKWSSESHRIFQEDPVPTDFHFDRYLEKIRPDIRPQLAQAVAKLMESGEGFDLKVPLTTKSGKLIWVRMTGQIFADQEDEYSVGGIVQNITEDIFRGHQLDSLLASINDLIAEIDIEGKILNIWTKNDHILFLPRDEIVGTNVADILLAEDAKKVQELVRRTITEKVQTEMEYHSPFDENLWFNVRFCYLHDSPISDSRALAVITDISQRRAADREVQRSQALLFSIIDNVPAFIYVKDLAGHYTFVNKEFSQLMNILRPIAEGMTPQDIFGTKGSEIILERHREILETKSAITNEEYLFLGEGKTHWLSTRFPILDERGQIVALAGISTNVTEQKLQTAKLNQASKMASLGEMSGGVAHEISNPLTVMMGKASMLRSKIEKGCEDPEEMLRFVDRIEAMGERISKIIRGLRLFSRDGQKDEFQIHPLRTVVDETLEFCRSRFQTGGIIIDVDSIPDELEIEMRSVEISQVLLNLMNNAYDAIKGDKRTPDQASRPQSYYIKSREIHAVGFGRVAVEFSDHGDSVSIAIADSGPGVPAHLRDQIMIPFFTTKEVGKGIGLGLSLSRGIAERHHGSLVLAPGSNETRFILTIPKRQTAKN